MQWVERIDRVGDRLVPVYIDSSGYRTTGSLRSTKSLMPRQGYKSADVEEASLESMEPVSAREYLDAIGFAHADPSGHQVFSLRVDGRRALIPTAVLLCALVGRMSAVGDRLLEAASLDRIAVPTVNGGRLQIEFDRKAKLTQDAVLPSVQARYTWLTCYPTARRLWNSVYASAVDGRLGLIPAKAIVKASLIGHRTADTIFVTRMVVRSLNPEEHPLPFAAAHHSGPFEFYEHSALHADKLSAFRAALRDSGSLHPCCKVQTDIPQGPEGWRMTAGEWQFVLGELRKAGFKSQVSVKNNINRALEKYATGTPWTAMGPDWRSAQKIYQHWARRGQWDLLKRLLAEMRAHGA